LNADAERDADGATIGRCACEPASGAVSQALPRGMRSLTADASAVRAERTRQTRSCRIDDAGLMRGRANPDARTQCHSGQLWRVVVGSAERPSPAATWPCPLDGLLQGWLPSLG
jgi:hypothetical protein